MPILSTANEDAKEIVIEAGDSLLPGKGVILSTITLPLDDTFDKTLREIFLDNLSDTQEKCGRFNLFAYLRSKDGQILEFDSLALEKPCSDNPGLRLKVNKNSDKVQSGLQPGSNNPFKIIGIDSISVENVAAACTQDIEACNQTDLQVCKYLLNNLPI